MPGTIVDFQQPAHRAAALPMQLPQALGWFSIALGLGGPHKASATLALVSLAGVTTLYVMCNGMLARQKA